MYMIFIHSVSFGVIVNNTAIGYITIQSTTGSSYGCAIL